MRIGMEHIVGVVQRDPLQPLQVQVGLQLVKQRICLDPIRFLLFYKNASIHSLSHRRQFLLHSPFLS